MKYLILLILLIGCSEEIIEKENRCIKIMSSKGDGWDLFGEHIDASENLLLVGATGAKYRYPNYGTVSVFRRYSDGFNEEKRFTSRQSQGLDGFGRAVAVSDNLAVIGAFMDNDTGAVYIFRNINEKWNQEQTLINSDYSNNSYFGKTLSLDGNILLISAHESTEKGAAYIFRYNGSWYEEQKLEPTINNTKVNEFGRGLALSGNVAVMGSCYDNSTDVGAGSVYVFRYNGSKWNEEQKLVGSNLTSFSIMGLPVSVDGDVIVAGARNQGSTNSSYFDGYGAAYVFRYNGSWYEEQELRASDSKRGANFGHGVSVLEDTILVGAPNKRLGNGSAYVFKYINKSWVEVEKIVAFDSKMWDEFGSYVTQSSTHYFIGAPKNNEKGHRAGAVYACKR